jgi:hypothetical protein
MGANMRVPSRLVALFAIAGCSAASPEEEVDDTTDDGGVASSEESSGLGSSESDADESGEESSSSSSEGDTGDTPAPSDCDPWAQDCPAEEKCMPYERDPVDTFVWDALGCFPLVANAKEPGDECTVVENGVSGMDDCTKGAMCMGVDEETLQGVCIAMCEGTPAVPACADTSNTCIIANDGVILVCLPQCDPLVQDCAEGEGCYESGTGGFFCFAQDENAAGDAAYGEPCMTLNYCNAGLICVPAPTVPGCDSEYCCSEICDASEGPEQCAGASDGQECAPYFPADAAPPNLTDVGVCAIPQ